MHKPMGVRSAVGDLFLVFFGLGEFVFDWPLRKHRGDNMVGLFVCMLI